ncbi:MAG: hypothetical protein COV45_00675 [Deltaproteobacteria bacterium CG11_big_fil_rev_8_21_14_0_20_47_16]|nr:MAG: hypothetical protein COV45_00675 [Deltaproteobacteria bacterium CG11_big_fil_rev_8_21_14_0_20_47_16]
MFGKKNEMVAGNSVPFNQMNGLLDRGCSFRGRLTFDGTVQINGDFEGEIFSDGILVVGPEARINAKVSVGSLVVHGQLQGEVEAKNRIEMHAPAKIRANITTPNLSIEEGVLFLGQCHMEPESPAEKPLVRPELQDGICEDDDVLVM